MKCKLTDQQARRFEYRFGRFVNEFREDVATNYEEKVAKLLYIIGSRCESPIETMLTGCMLLDLVKDGFERDLFVYDCDKDWRSDCGERHGIHMYAQGTVDCYRADIMVQVQGAHGRKTVVVECDGHDYHERTKQQAKHDRKRDRYMLSKGILVLRFTGSEIWADAKECAEQVSSEVISRLAEVS